MLRICSRTLVKVGMAKPRHLVKPVPVTLAAGRNLTQQKELPSLPVPPLQQTCETYLSILEPVLEADELKHTKKLVEEFQKPGGIGERLQRSLERKAQQTDNWFISTEMDLYLNKRLSLMFSNTAALLPRMDFSDKQAQIRHAAEVVAGFLHVNTMIKNKTLPAESMGGRPLCMKQYDQGMSSCRIPGQKRDTFEFHAKSPTPPKHISVIHNCQVFVFDVYKSNGTLLTSDELRVQLERICESSVKRDTEPVSIFTSQHRDIWSKAYDSLIKDQTNKESLSAIQSSIFTACLDGPMPPTPDGMYRYSAIRQVLHGGGSQWNSGNRWFDKGWQVIIGEDGTAGVCTSHAATDGIVGMLTVDYAADYLMRKKPQMTQTPMEPLPVPQKLHFNITPEVKNLIEDAKQHTDKVVQDLDVRFKLPFDSYGKNFLKAHKTSPDAFMQMALQLAYYRVHQRCCPTCEPITMRPFSRGRLCMINVNTTDSAAFVKAFDDPKIQNSEKLDLLNKAIKLHRWHTKMAVSGQPTESHLLGLKMQAVEENISMPDIFTDPSYSKAFDYQLSTSQVTSKTGSLPILGTDGPGIYSVSYSIMDNCIELMLYYAEDETCRENNAEKLMLAIEDALLDMRTLLEQTPRAEL